MTSVVRRRLGPSATPEVTGVGPAPKTDMGRQIRNLVEAEDWWGIGIGVVVSIAAVVILLPLVSDRCTSVSLRRHQGTLPYGAWAALQPVPSMYNYSHRVVVTKVPDPYTDNERREVFRDRVPHFPANFVYKIRPVVREGSGCFEVRMRSRFRGTTVESLYFVCSERTGSGRRLSIRRFGTQGQRRRHEE